MNEELKIVKTEIYDKCSFKFSDFLLEEESQDYDACRFKLNGLNIISRTAKVTPKKNGQFVTFWRRSEDGPIEPLHETDRFDFYIVQVRLGKKFGQFVFPKSILIKKGILSTDIKEGKRAFRVYPIWDTPKSKQAERTQKWQLKYFYDIINSLALDRVIELYKAE